ncbi:unnamed protein product, partial [Discosporangium mesarthrocarpum]
LVQVRNRVDRRLYAVKKVTLDLADRETSRKIRREVTTISKLIHKNIVRRVASGGFSCPAVKMLSLSDSSPLLVSIY